MVAVEVEEGLSVEWRPLNPRYPRSTPLKPETLILARALALSFALRLALLPHPYLLTLP